MSEIDALTRRVQELNAAVDCWNTVMLWGLGLAALAAVLIGISTRLVVVRSSALGQAQIDLGNAKESALAVILKSKDLEVEHAKRDASEATLKAYSAQLRALHSANSASILRLDTEQAKQDRYTFSFDENPRRLTAAQKDTLSKAVAQYGFSQNVDIFTFRGREEVNLGIDIARALPDWSVEFFWANRSRFKGIQIEYNPGNPMSEKQAFTVFRQLTELGLMTGKPTPTLPHHGVDTGELSVGGIPANAPLRITVGEKLPAPFPSS